MSVDMAPTRYLALDYACILEVLHGLFVPYGAAEWFYLCRACSTGLCSDGIPMTGDPTTVCVANIRFLTGGFTFFDWGLGMQLCCKQTALLLTEDCVRDSTRVAKCLAPTIYSCLYLPALNVVHETSCLVVWIPLFLDPSDGVFGRFDLAALCGCRTLNFCLFCFTQTCSYLDFNQFLIRRITRNICLRLRIKQIQILTCREQDTMP